MRGDGRFHGSASWCPGAVLRCLRWSGGRVREGDDGGGGPGGDVRASCAGEGAGALGLAGAVPVPVDDGAVFRELPGQRRAAGPAGAERGSHDAAGAAVGDLAGLDALPGAASLPGGGGGERGGAGDAGVISFPAAQAASSCRTRPGLPERNIGPADGPAPSRLAFTSRSAVPTRPTATYRARRVPARGTP